MHEVLKAVNKIVGKGDPIVMTGMTCSGKSTVLVAENRQFLEHLLRTIS